MTDTVVPRPQAVSKSDEQIDLSEMSGISHQPGDVPSAGATQISSLLADELGLSIEQIPTGQDSGIPIRVEQTDEIEGMSSEEAYTLSITASEISIQAPTTTGLYYGGQTLVQLATLEESRLLVPTCEIHDWPEHEWRGFMADPARGFIPVERLKTLIDKMARAKLNTFHLHLVDSEAWTLEFEGYPELGENADGESLPTYSREDITELVEYADEREIRVIPEIDLPGHGLTLLTQLPALRCETGEEARSFGRKSAICIGQERTYEFVEDILQEVVELFPSDIVHIGADEWIHHGVNWEHCDHCQQRMREEGHEDVRELFYYFLRRVHGILDDHGKRMMVWNDQIDISESPDLPKDILIHFWLVSHGAWGPPQEGNSMQRFVEEGFEVINSRSSATYANCLVEDLLFDWNPLRFPTVDPEHESSVLGSEMPAWNGWRTDARERYYKRVLPSMLPVYADRVWNGTTIEDRDAFSEAVTRHVLGPTTPSGFDLYRDLGGIVLPTGDAEEAHWADYRTLLRERPISESIESCRRSLEVLHELEAAKFPPSPDVVEAYVDTLTWLIDALDRERRGVSNKSDTVPEIE